MQRRLQLIWASLPKQLDCNTHKFRYNAVAPGLGIRELKAPMEWLVENGLIRQIPRVDLPELPLEAHRDGAFKGYPPGCRTVDRQIATADEQFPGGFQNL